MNQIFQHVIRRYMGLLLLAVLSSSIFVTILAYGQDAAPPGDQTKKKKGPGTPVVNARELPVDLTAETMEVLRTSLGVECNYCHVSGDFEERGHVGDRQNDGNPRKLIAREMIKMTKETNKTLTGVGVFPDPSNVVTCWSCHRGSRRPPTSAVTAAANAESPAPAQN